MLVFAWPSEAVRFAMELVPRLRALTREIGREICDRVGIHVGEVVIEQQGGTSKLFGMQVDMCARVTGLAGPNHVLMTRFAFVR